MAKIISVVGARPNFMKIAPIADAMQAVPALQHVIVHTGQHYDENMSKTFFEELGIPKPDLNLEVGSGSHAVQTAEVMKRFEQVLLEQRPDLVLVVGDVNSTLACTVTAAKMQIKVAHVEAGLRSRDRAMPEEINRLVTDTLADLLYTTCKEADDNLKQEGVPADKIFFVGNVMIDTLVRHLELAKQSQSLKQLELEPDGYALVTLHRPSNVDNKEILTGILDALDHVQAKVPVAFPVHPRTRKQLDNFGLLDRLNKMANVRQTGPQGYLDFLNLTANAKLVLTDSGGIQEETTYLGIPCLTLRENTERGITCEVGTNTLTGPDPAVVIETADRVLAQGCPNARIPDLWDGKAAERIVDHLGQILS